MKQKLTILLATLLLVASAFGKAGNVLEIENDFYAVKIGAQDGSFAVGSKPEHKEFLSNGKLAGTNGIGHLIKITDKVFGRGNAIEITYPNGNREVITLYPNLPFVTFRSTFRNAESQPIILNHVPGVSAQVDLGATPAEIHILGTGGLLEPAKNPGSYEFLSVVQPHTRNGVVGGWLTHDRGSGVVFSPTAGETTRIQSRMDYGRLRIKPGENAEGEMFALGYFNDARFGLEAYADAIAKIYAIKLPPHHPGFCTWYMEKNEGASDEKHLAEIAAYAAKNLKPYGFDFIQIDDGWQSGIKSNGPRKNFTTNSADGPYPSGMKATADMIAGFGFTPGIWFMPFAGTWNDPYFKEHQDWFAKGPDGKPYDTAWGGTCLDMTQPGAREHTRSVAHRIAHDWDYRLFKLDGFWTGSATRQIYVNDGYKDDGIGETEFSAPDTSNIQALREGCRLIREGAGPNVFLLGCCVAQNMRSFGGSFGLLDAMRVGPDTGAGEIGATPASRLWFLNGRVWWNDPDCVSVRASTPLEQARLNASFTAIAGDLFYNSDWMPDFPPERLDILRRCMPSHNLAARPVDVFENEPARIWHLADTNSNRRDVVALYNWGKEPVTISYPIDRLGLPPAKEYVGFDFWNNKFIQAFKKELRAELPAGGSCRILAIQPTSEHPQLISTSRHITQGMLDVSDEKWNEAKSRLTGASQIVANDPYELRIIFPTGSPAWIAKSLTVTKQGEAAGVTTEFKQEGNTLRALLTSPVSGEVKWQVQFARGLGN